MEGSRVEEAMARSRPAPSATREQVLECVRQDCAICGSQLWNDYDNYRRVRTLTGVVQLQLKVRRCPNQDCERFHQPYRPESEGKWALPQHEFGLDVVALVGTLRYQEHRSVPQIHQQLQQRGLCVCERTVSHLLERYDELLAVKVGDCERLRAIVAKQGRVILAIDGLQPDVGHEVLWVIRDCLSGELLLARSLLSSRYEDLAVLLQEVEQGVGGPIAGVVSDGQQAIRKAVKTALAGVNHGLCHFHYLREAVKPIYEADRHAKKELKKRVRGVRRIERSVSETKTETEAQMSQVVGGYCQAVRAALTDDGRPPLEPAGLRLQQRLAAIEQSLERVEKKGSCPSL